jgi:hypothetical protein
MGIVLLFHWGVGDSVAGIDHGVCSRRNFRARNPKTFGFPPEHHRNVFIGEEYISWASKTPAFFPRLRNWTKPDLPFLWKMALFREYHGIYGLISSLFLMEVVGDFYIHKLRFDLVWVTFFISGTFFMQ